MRLTSNAVAALAIYHSDMLLIIEFAGTIVKFTNSSALKDRWEKNLKMLACFWPALNILRIENDDKLLEIIKSNWKQSIAPFYAQGSKKEILTGT